MATAIRTLCHRCRGMNAVRTVDADDVMRVHNVPDGDPAGVIVTELQGGYQTRTCPDCDGTGWLPGFVSPG